MTVKTQAYDRSFSFFFLDPNLHVRVQGYDRSARRSSEWVAHKVVLTLTCVTELSLVAINSKPRP